MECYAKRLHNPFQGVVQIVANEQLRALSFDGVQWELQFRCDLRQMKPTLSTLMPRFQYARIGRWDARNGFKPYPLDPAIDSEAVERASLPLLAALAQTRPPLPQDDAYEWWLLDEKEGRPLALLASCRHAGDMKDASIRPVWKSINASQLPLDNTGDEIRKGLPPVNYRLESLVKQRAGQNPVARWFRRQDDQTGQEMTAEGNVRNTLSARLFPELMLREDWEKPAEQDLCARYLTRLAPQLLVLQNLSHSGRDRLEQMASRHVIELDQYFHLYPTVADPQRMTAFRVEARLRMACGGQKG